MKQILLSVSLVILLIGFGECFRASKIKEIKLNQQNKIKIIDYVVREGDSLKIRRMPVRNVQINPTVMDWVAKGYFIGNNYNQTGWSYLEIETNESACDYHQAFSLGYLEGSLTRDFISLHLINTVGDFCDDGSTSCQKLINFLNINNNWVKEQIEQHPDDPYWHQVKLVYAQFFGLYHGYYNISVKMGSISDHLTLMSKDIKPYLKLIALQLNGDMSELLASFDQTSNPFIAGSCSALIKLLPNNSDLYVSHVTWTVFESMLRILKHIKTNYHLNDMDNVVIPGSEMSYSSYPGILSSIDDFYVLKSRLVVLETTIGNSNPDLWKYVTPQTNLYWVRNQVANRLAYTGADWAKWFSLYNSGTYNNEWMVIDYKLFYPNQPLRDGLFTVLEQLPGMIVWEDKTDVLRNQSYWPSYNIAFYETVYNISGTYDAFVKYGSFFSYSESPRANIFRRDNHKVKDLNSMINLMRYNNFTNDPFSRCDCNPPYSGENTISARSDLNPADGVYPFDALGHRDHGATDMKLTNWELSQNFEFIAVCGPTYDNRDITPFSWSKADFGNTTNHYGLTDTYEFEPVHVTWSY